MKKLPDHPVQDLPVLRGYRLEQRLKEAPLGLLGLPHCAGGGGQQAQMDVTPVLRVLCSGQKATPGQTVH